MPDLFDLTMHLRSHDSEKQRKIKCKTETALLTSSSHAAQTDIKDAGSPSADDFLARERALLGDDATQFATNNDDLLGEGRVGAEEQVPEAAQFESQFPDLTNEVRFHIAPSPSPWPPASRTVRAA